MEPRRDEKPFDEARPEPQPERATRGAFSFLCEQSGMSAFLDRSGSAPEELDGRSVTTDGRTEAARNPLPGNRDGPPLAELLGDVLKHFQGWSRDTGTHGIELPFARIRDELSHTYQRLRARQHLMGGSRYSGHMNTYPLLPALLAGFLADLLGLNMLVPEQSRSARDLEKTVLDDLCHLVGFPQGGGRLTSGGTLSNTEALYLAYLTACFPEQTRSLARSVGVAPPRQAPREVVAYGARLVERLTDAVGGRAWSLLGDCLARPAPPRRRAVLAGRNAHYSVEKATRLIGGNALAYIPIDVDDQFRLDAAALGRRLHQLRAQDVQVVAVVSTAGSTATGSFDPADEIARLQERDGFWWHVDAAYGGYFRSLLFDAPPSPEGRPVYNPARPSALPPATRRSLAALSRATSLSLDPHKLGYVPKGCGALLLQVPETAALIQQQAGYFRDTAAHEFRLQRRQCFESGLEGSRSGRGPTACYVMHRLLPLHGDGHGRVLERTVERARRVWRALQDVSLGGCRFLPLHTPMSNIFCVVFGRRGDDLHEVNRRTRALADAVAEGEHLYCTLTSFFPEDGPQLFRHTLPGLGITNRTGLQELDALRFVFSNPQAFAEGIGDFVAVAAEVVKDRVGGATSPKTLVG